MASTSWDRRGEAHAVLHAIVSDPDYGVAALSSPQAMSSLLKDLLPDAPREAGVLVAAAEAGLAKALAGYRAQGMDLGTATALAVRSFAARTAFTADACHWAVSELAAAAGFDTGGAGRAGDLPDDPLAEGSRRAVRAAYWPPAAPADRPPYAAPSRSGASGEKKGKPAQRSWQRWLAAAASAVLVAASAVIFTGSRFASSSAGHPPAAHPNLPSSPLSYLGVYAAGSPPGYKPIADFAEAAGRQANLVGYFSGWAEPFPTSYAQTIRKHGAALIVQIDPRYASVAGIAAGYYDGYLSSYADSVRHFGFPVIIGFGHEMNARWYPWGYGHPATSAFVAAWRHIVTLFRGQGAENVTWLWTISADGPATGPVAFWWPGSRYVTWVGIDGYYVGPSDTFARVFGTTIDQVRAFTHKPMLLSETAVGPRAGQFVKIGDLFAGMHQYGTLGLVWLDEAQDSGIFHQDWRLEDSPAAEAAFQLGASALTLARP